MKLLLKIVLISIFSSVLPSYGADTRVVVVPLMGEMANLQNVVTVSKKNGDFTTIAAALQSIRDANSSNPYLIIVGPGVYNIAQTIVMKDHVSLIGSGLETTTLSGSFNGTSASSSPIIRTSNHSRISNMTIQSHGEGRSTPIGILSAKKVQSVISGVAVSVSGGNSSNIGISVESPSNRIHPRFPSIADSYIRILGGGANARNRGISTVGDGNGPYFAKNVDIQVIPRNRAGSLNFGISSEFGTLKLVDLNINVLANNNAYGIVANLNTNLVRNSEVVASSAAISASNITSDTKTIVKVAHSSLSSSSRVNSENTITRGGADFICVNSDNGRDLELNADCSVVD